MVINYHALLFTDEKKDQVKNSKSTNFSAHGLHYTVLLHSLSLSSLQTINSRTKQPDARIVSVSCTETVEGFTPAIS